MTPKTINPYIKRTAKAPMNRFLIYQSSNVQTYDKNQTHAKIKKVRYILLYRTNAFLMAGALGIEPRSTVLETDVEPFNYTPIYVALIF